MKNLLKSKKAEGFTIIEVMIVLAIAGLIMVIVFIAVPQLQRNQRDNARQNIANRVESEMETFAGNNQGTYPLDGAAAANFTRFNAQYFGAANFNKKNPKTGVDYTLAFAGGNKAAAANAPGPGVINIYPGATCTGEDTAGWTAPSAANPARSVALVVQLDSGQNYYCIDNS
jgi:prepilin-type N-terminal cleavage/methylation domain-containing protein